MNTRACWKASSQHLVHFAFGLNALLDQGWTKEETDYLFRVVGEYDLRWYVIHDRYNYPDGTPRTIEVFPLPCIAVCGITLGTGFKGSLL